MRGLAKVKGAIQNKVAVVPFGAPTYRHHKYVGLVLPTKIYDHKLTKTQIWYAVKAYQGGVNLTTKQPEPELQSETSRKGQQLAYMIGLFQNPKARKEDIQQAWTLYGGFAVLEWLFEANIPWSDQVLEVILGKLENIIPGSARYSVVGALHTVGRYKY